MLAGRRVGLTVVVAALAWLTGGELAHPQAADRPAPAAVVLRTPAPSPPRTPQPAPAASVTAPFSSSVGVITPAIRARMGRSWHPGCPVPLSDLRYVQVSFWDFTGAPRRGELVVNESTVPAVVRAMHSLYDAHFPILDMRLVDAYGGGNNAAMAARTTAAFNCRPVTGRPGTWSQHAYGLAIDINPVQNPYIGVGGAVEPPGSRAYIDRARRTAGMIHAGDAAVRAFAAVGWGWGGDWRSIKDYQHFSASGR